MTARQNRILLVFIPALLVLGGGSGFWWLSRESCRLLFTAHKGPIRCLAVSADGRFLVTGGADRKVNVWSLPGGSSVATLAGHPGDISAVAVAPTTGLVASGCSSGIMKVWDVAEQKESTSLPAHRNGLSSLLFTPDGQTLISAGADRLIRFWDVRTAKEKRVIKGQGGAIWTMALSPDGQILATAGSGDRVIHLWNMPGGTPARELRGHQARVLALAFHGKGTLVSGDRNGIVKVWNLDRRSEQNSQAHRDRVTGLAVLAGGQILLSASEDRELLHWPLAGFPENSGRWQQRSPVEAMVPLPDGSGVVTAGADGRVRIWDVPANSSQTTVTGP